MCQRHHQPQLRMALEADLGFGPLMPAIMPRFAYPVKAISAFLTWILDIGRPMRRFAISVESGESSR